MNLDRIQRCCGYKIVLPWNFIKELQENDHTTQFTYNMVCRRFSVNMIVCRGPSQIAYKVHARYLVLCTHSGFEEGGLAVARHYPTPVNQSIPMDPKYSVINFKAPVL